MQSSKDPLLVDLHRMCLLPQQQVVTTLEKCCPPGSSLETPRPRFYWELLTEAVSAWMAPYVQTPRRKAGVQEKPCCLHIFRHNGPLTSILGMVLPASLKSSISDTNQGSTLQNLASRTFKAQKQGLLFSSFLHRRFILHITWRNNSIST